MPYIDYICVSQFTSAYKQNSLFMETFGDLSN